MTKHWESSYATYTVHKGGGCGGHYFIIVNVKQPWPAAYQVDLLRGFTREQVEDFYTKTRDVVN